MDPLPIDTGRPHSASPFLDVDNQKEENGLRKWLGQSERLLEEYDAFSWRNEILVKCTLRTMLARRHTECCLKLYVTVNAGSE